MGARVPNVGADVGEVGASVRIATQVCVCVILEYWPAGHLFAGAACKRRCAWAVSLCNGA